jgi:methylmalonyl-CoA mutase
MMDAMGLQGMINDLVQQSDFPTGDKLTNEVRAIRGENPTALANHICGREFPDVAAKTLELIQKKIVKHQY